MDRISWAMLLSLGFLWGGSFFFAEILLLKMHPFHIVFFRTSIAAVAMVLLLYVRGVGLPFNVGAWITFLILGFFNNALPFSSIVFGQQYISGGLASILNASTAIIGVVISGIVLADERMNPKKMIGVIIGTFGVVITIGIEHLFELSPTSIGQLCIILASFSYVIASIFGKGQVAKYGVDIMATGMLIGASVWMFIISVIVEGVPVMPLDRTSILVVLALAVLCTSIAYLFYFAILKRAGASNLLLVTIIVPIFALLLDALALGEIVNIRQATGFVIIAIGLLILDGKIPLPQFKLKSKHD